MIMKKFLFILTVIAGLFVSNAEARMKIRIPVDNSNLPTLLPHSRIK